MTVHIEYDEAVDLLQRAVAEKGPDFVYRDEDGRLGPDGSCSYFHWDKDSKAFTPGCIIGHVLSYKGIVAEIEGGVPDLIATDVIDVDERTQKLLTVAQTEQDQATPWGDALAAALTVTKENTYA